MYFLLFSHSWIHTAICDSFPAGARVLASGKPGTICFYWSNQICYRGMGGSDERMMAAKKKGLSLHLVHNEEEALSLLFKVQKEVVATGATAAILSAIPGVNKSMNSSKGPQCGKRWCQREVSCQVKCSK